MMGNLIHSKTGIGKKGKKLVGIKNGGRFGIRIENDNIQSHPPKEVRGQS